MDKPKEFWIAPEIEKPISDFIPMYRKAYDDKGDNGQEIHVIEYSAYEQLQSKLDKVCAALEKVKHNGCCMICSSDCPACSAHFSLNQIRKKGDNG